MPFLNLILFSLHWTHGLFVLGGVGIGIVIVLLFRKKYLLRYERKYMQEIKAWERNRNEELRARFLHNLSHELRTPLTMIIGPARRLRTEKDETIRKEIIDVIHRSANRQLRLINQLLAAAQIEDNLLSLTGKQQDLALFIDQIWSGFQPRARFFKIDTKINWPESGRLLHFDPEKVEILFISLFSSIVEGVNMHGYFRMNMDILENGGGENQPGIQVQIEYSGKIFGAKPAAELFVRDLDIDPENYRMDLDRKLPLAKEYMELHEGSIELATGEESGITITLFFPYENPVSRMYAASSPPTAQLDSDSSHPLIQVIEPNADLSNLLVRELRSFYRVETSNQPREGLRKAKENVPDLILAARSMPGIDGLEVLKTLKSEAATSHIPVMLLTSRTGRKEKLSELEEGADTMLSHPFDTEELILKVRNLLNLRDQWSKRYQATPWTELRAKEKQNREDAFVQQTVAKILNHLDDSSLSVDSLAKEIGVSGKQLQRKLKALTGKSPNQLIRSVRMDKAKEFLAQTDQTIAEVGYAVGFSSPSYFTKVFTESFEVSPSEFRGAIS